MVASAAVPVKDFVNAKTRLRRALSPAERAALARAMLRDVLRALQTARLNAVWVVTGDEEVAATAEAFGARVLREPSARGHTGAVALAQAHLTRDSDIFVTVPGDVPCVTAGEIDELVANIGARRPAAVLVPSRSGLGTNGVALAPPAALPLRFGEPSFETHLRAAQEAGLAPRVTHLPGLALDIDTPDDLRTLLIEGGHTESGALVAAWRIADRRTLTGAVTARGTP